MPRYVVRIVLFLAAAMLLRGVYSEIRTWKTQTWNDYEEDCDFPVYYTAAWLVRTDLNVHIYDEAQLNIDPIYGSADPHSVFARTAAAHGIPIVSRYIYPPTLADLMVPLTVLPHRQALVAWHLVNFLLLLATSILLARMLGVRLRGQIALVAVLLFLFRPTLCCFYYGQVPVLLMFLLITGFSLYRSGRRNWAGLVFALAIAIKLTPLIVVVPLLAWREWRTLRAIALGCVAILGLLWAVNGSAALMLYAQHVVPSMLYRSLDMTNINLGMSLQVLWYGSDKGMPLESIALLSKILSVLILGYAGWLSRCRPGETLSDDHKLSVFAVFLMISCCISPVSWLHAYTLSAPALLILVRQIRNGQSNLAEAFLMLGFLFVNSSTKFVNWAWTTHLTILYDLASLTPILGLTLGLFMLHRLQSERRQMQTRSLAAANATA